MNNWIRSNFPVLMMIGTLVTGLILQWNYFSQAAALTYKNDLAIQQHLLDTQHHLDPYRDERRIQDIINRLDRMERKIDDLAH